MLILDSAVKRDLQFDTGTFTMDVNNMNFCSVSKRPFACTDHRGHHIWMHLPPHDASAALRTYIAQKAHAPFTTSCCILVPAWKKASYSRLLNGMTLLRRFDKGCPIFRLQNGQQQCAPYPVRIYHDAVWPQPSRCNLADAMTAASMKFTGIVKGQPVSIMFDTGSDASFANKRICHTLQLPIEPLCNGSGQSAISIRLIPYSYVGPTSPSHTFRARSLWQGGVPLHPGAATECPASRGRAFLSANATCATAVTLKGVCFPVRCFVMNLPAQHDFILGEDFMQMARTRLDYAGGACTLQQGRKTICLPCHVLPAPPIYSERASAAPVSAAAIVCSPSKSPNLGMITAARLRQAYDKGCTIFAVQIMSADKSGSVQLQAVPFLGATSCDPDVHPSAPAHLQAGIKDILQEFAEIKRQLQDYVAKGHVEPSSSPFGVPVLFVQKKDGGLRMCVDYRALNKVTVSNRYPLPRIDEMLDQLHGAKYFSSLDLQSGYHQIRIDPADVEKTAFRTPYGLYQFKVLSFGLTNAPATFQRVMNDTFRQELGAYVLVYLDDILVFSRTVEDHLQHLRCVLSKLRQHRLYAKLSKCHFGRTELPFLGHIVGAEGIRVDPRKTDVVKNWPTPTCMEDVRRFLGLAGYFRNILCKAMLAKSHA